MSLLLSTIQSLPRGLNEYWVSVVRFTNECVCASHPVAPLDEAPAAPGLRPSIEALCGSAGPRCRDR